MSARNIIRYGDPILTRCCSPVTEFNEELTGLIDDMLETMHASSGIGLAANQIGVPKSVAVVDLSLGEDPGALIVMVNPVLVFENGVRREEEGCLINTMMWFSREHSSILPYIANLGDTVEESQQVKSTFEQYYKGTGHALKGLLGILQGDPQIMNTEFEMARKANPFERDVQSCLDEMNLEIKALEEAIERTPNKPILRSRLAKRYLLLNNYEAAREQYEKFILLEPENAQGWNNLGICYNRLEQSKKAIKAFETAVEHNDKQMSAYFNLGLLYGKAGNFTASAENFEKALFLSPRNPRIYDRLAWVYVMQKDYNRSLEMIDKALSLVEKDTPFYNFLQDRKAAVTRAIEETKR